MDKNNEDEPTIILEFNKLTIQDQNDEQTSSDIIELEDEIRFGNNIDEESELVGETTSTFTNIQIKPNLFFISLGTNFFNKIKLKASFPDFVEIQNIEELNLRLKASGNSLFLLYFNSNPKLTNKILSEFNSKFSSKNTLLSAKNISKEKAEKHMISKSGAKGYLSYPFTVNDLEKNIEEIS